MTEAPPDLPEYAGNPFINRLPPLRDAKTALEDLTSLPIHAEAERAYPAHLRAHCLQRLTHYFDPNERHIDLDQRIELMIRQGYVGRNPLTTSYIDHLANGHARVMARNLETAPRVAESTASGIALIGVSGMGKTRSVQRILSRYTPQVIVHEEPFLLHQVVWLRLDCPSLGSRKQLCFSFFKKMDELLGTNFEARHGGAREPVDKMLPQMGAIANRHALGLLVIDEIQHLIEAKGSGREELLNFLVTLVNMVGVPVLLIGTPRALPLLDGAFRQARRVSGLGSLLWDRRPPDETWDDFVTRMWRCQWTRTPSPLTDDVRAAFYDESQGVIDIVIKLYLLAQLKAVQLGALADDPEIIDAPLLRHVAKESLGLVRPMLDALRRDDRRALERYDDLTSFDIHVRQVLADAAATMPRRVPLSQEPPVAAATTARPDEGGAHILAVLGQLGVAADVARAVIAEIRAETPDLSPLDLVHAVAERLKDRPSLGKTARRPRRPKACPPETQPSPDDLRGATVESASGHAGLLAASMLRAPADDTDLISRDAARG
ncbi:ATP-binding protein [Rubrimonas cliftonensis]|uniref:AAA domain-containing protein n=1 Tax=Rubrimonas cliftonensis TaxID=89524 RepID=A0A1H4CT54_9RHOB|nr:ATP-binding protein [Rubrimonas cliftonensis]SEA63565.1 AAA domain-containing protein [Rubrimonas cliftonensis]